MIPQQNTASSFLTQKWRVESKRVIDYSVLVSENIFSPENTTLLIGGRTSNSRRFVILDDKIAPQYQNQIESYFRSFNIEASVYLLESGENNKSSEQFDRLFSAVEQFQPDRRSEPLIGIGGGVLTDLVGFVASTYRRGIPHVKVPTTLMGYVDASVGIKTGINVLGQKNRMGTFEPPVGVLLDRKFLKSLSDRHLRNGLGEIVKMAVIRDRHLVHLLERFGKEAIQNQFQDEPSKLILYYSIRGMIEELSPNLYEENLERCVDFGHTFSPILEMFDVDNLLHGEAVAIDIMFTTVMAQERGYISIEERERVYHLLRNLGLPWNHFALKPHLLWKGLEERTHHRDGLQRVPLPSPLGQCRFVNDITFSELVKLCNFMETYHA